MNLLGIDFEDWYHPELIQRQLKTQNNKPTVVNGIDKILDWLRKKETFATFFMVGELLEFKPELLDKILAGGHEIGFHSMYHTRLDSPNYREKFTEEIKRFDALTSKKSRGFRAPTFSLNHNSAWAIDVLSENNYVYDSSVVPAKTKLYGVPDAQTRPYRITSKNLERDDPSGKIMEFPLLVTKILGRKIPACGGFYLRALPLRIIENAIRNSNEQNIPASFYIHSWELTPEFMPKVPLSFIENFVTYYNLGNALKKMDRLIKKFKFTSFIRFLSEAKF
ncbi:MAG TPA: polysaccharide deacetylase family protein [Nitrosopumilaceae archaeon]|nr:polysaccharide deacetylase family protein [Nitrosopumilaceae archaeon]